MKTYLHIFCFAFALLFGSLRAAATHIFGGELLYTHVAGNTYTLTLTLYGDCAAPGSTFNTLYTAEPLVVVYRGASFTDSLRLQPETGTGIEVSPVCPSQLNNTECNGGTLPGVTKFVYSANIVLSGFDANWRFVFNGNLGSTSAGRSSNITNIFAPSNVNLVTLEASLNNINGPNSSPQYSAIPTPFYALNLPQEYNNGSVDPDADSLRFDLIAGTDANGDPVNYVGTASASQPLYTAPGQFTFNHNTGQMSFLPNILQDALVVNKVSEYKNGTMVGTSMREMTFIVLDNLGSFNNIRNTQPVNISGGALTATNTVSSCKSMLSFDILPGDTAHNNITVTYTTLPPGATIAVSDNGTTDPVVHFTWNTALHPVGNYIFYVTYKNNACPISTSQTIAYTISITDPYTFISANQQDAGCETAIPVTIVFSGKTPVNLYITQQADTLWKLACQVDTVTVNVPAGELTATLVSTDKACVTPFNFTVTDSTALPCCRFYYPTVFTPNNDGRNDEFKVITTSQPQRFEMHVYDRWGNRVFSSHDPNYGWDGTRDGKPCNADVYFYRVYAFCLGHTESQKGDITLLE